MNRDFGGEGGGGELVFVVFLFVFFKQESSSSLVVQCLDHTNEKYVHLLYLTQLPLLHGSSH